MLNKDDVKQEIDPDFRFIITGTHAYGPVTNESDLDIVMMPDAITVLHMFLEAKGIPIYRTEGQVGYGAGGGFYFDLGVIKVNIIVAENVFEFNDWVIRTERMKELPAIHDREKRLTVFNDLHRTS